MVSLGSYPTATSIDQLERLTEVMNEQAMLTRVSPAGIQKLVGS